jgi:glycosyltransferase involved in cell wall biosynthesis
MNRKNIIISPSGQLYGSEYVLLDFLRGSAHQYKIYAPKNSTFFYKLEEENFDVKGFKSLPVLYIKLFFEMLIFKKNLYVNEGGHISYVKILSKLLAKRKFVVSIRLLEDCDNKLNTIPTNITLIPVSNYIQSKIRTNGKVEVIYDPYKLSNKIDYNKETNINRGKIVIGIVGRISKSKGGGNLLSIINNLSPKDRGNFEFNFFGTYDSNSLWFINFKSQLDSLKNFNYNLIGFVNDKVEMYNSFDFLMHLNKEEPLGRILFEVIDFNTPFVIFNNGGIGELSTKLDLTKFSANNSLEYSNLMLDKLGDINNNCKQFLSAKKAIEENFSPLNYAKQIESFL